jgi:hypothetical protein
MYDNVEVRLKSLESSGPGRVFALALLLLALPGSATAQKFYGYVGDVGPNHVLLAWGTTTGENTIGRSSPPHGNAVVQINSKEIAVSDKNWTVISGLKPDTDYPYQILLNGKAVVNAKVRTWPEKADRLRFFVIGDYGGGGSAQRSVADAMIREFQRLSGDNPVRFILTTGDNLYGTIGFMLKYNNTGDKDTHWESRFFSPYAPLLRHIPFYPTLGNHDGNETESRADLPAYLDNFFFPPPHTPSRYYRFSYGGMADFFALDTTTNSESGPPRPAYSKDGDQHKWFAKNLGDSQVPWKIPFLHHPFFNAGPRHPAVAQEFTHFLDVMKRRGVKVVFTGHEHNFQFSKKNGETGDIRFIVSGAGGELRTGDVRGQMDRSQIEGWSRCCTFFRWRSKGVRCALCPWDPSQLS